MEGINIKPLLAHVYEPHRVTFPCYVQPKLNGIRALYQNGRFQSRDEHPFPIGLLDHLSTALRGCFDNQTILDGELYVHGWPLQRINAAVTPVRSEPTDDTRMVEYHVFDVVDYDRSFTDRLNIQTNIARARQAGDKVNLVYTERVYNALQADLCYVDFIGQGYEGMMYRLGDCPYTTPKQVKNWAGLDLNPRSRFLSDKDNRCWHLLKRKSWQDDEFEIVRIVEGEGKYQGMLGAITCTTGTWASPESTHFNVGSGFTDFDRAKYFVSPPLGRKAKVKYLCLSSDGIPLNPTLLAIL